MPTRRIIGPAAGLLLLGACAACGPPEIETSRMYQNVGADALYARTLEAPPRRVDRRGAGG